MNDCVPNWNIDEDFPSSNAILPTSNWRNSLSRPEGELPEVVWRNGHVGLKIKNNHEHEIIPIDQNPSPWMHYETLTKEFCSKPITNNKITEADGKNCSLNELGSSFGRTVLQQIMTSSEGHERKGEEESGGHSEDGEFQFLEDGTNHRRLVSARRSRDAHVHNLSERRRRDRINEKMKALQELIPQCNKADKATMLDEAIDYLKSLQLQVQLMWLGSNKTPMVFPNTGPVVGSLPSSAYVHVQMPRFALPKNHTIPLSATELNQTDASAYQSRFLNHLNAIFPDASLQGSQSVRASGNLQLHDGATIYSPDYFDI